MGCTPVSLLRAALETYIIWPKRWARKPDCMLSSSFISSCENLIISAPYRAALIATEVHKFIPLITGSKSWFVRPRIIPAWDFNLALHFFIASLKIPLAESVVIWTPKYLYLGACLMFPRNSLERHLCLQLYIPSRHNIAVNIHSCFF